MNGNNIFISANGAIVAATKSNELSTECGVIEVSSSLDGDFRHYIKGRKEWSMTVGFLVTAVKPTDPRNPLNVSETYTLTFENRADSSDRVSGDAICTQCKITTVRGNLANGTITFKGTGPLL